MDEARRWSGEVELALSWWRETREPLLAHVVCALSAKVEPTVELRGGKVAEDVRAWDAQEALGRREDLPALLGSAVGQGLKTQYRPGADLAASRLERLVARGPDPRVTREVTAWVGEFLYSSQPLTHRYWTLVKKILTEDTDPHFDFGAFADARVHELAAGFASAKRLSLAHWLRQLEPRPPATKAVPDEVRGQLDTWLAEVGRPEVAARAVPTAQFSEDDLLATIYADPDDEAARRVYSDYLQDRGGPRASFMLEQLRRFDADRPTADGGHWRVTRHGFGDPYRQHRPMWLGPHFAAMATRIEYRMGFPVVAELGHALKELPRAVGEPGLKTLRGLAVRRRDWNVNKPLVQLLRDPGLAHLTHLRTVTLLELKAMGRVSFSLESIELVADHPFDRVGEYLANVGSPTRVCVVGPTPSPTDLAQLAVPRVGVWAEGAQIREITEHLAPAVRNLEITLGHSQCLKLQRPSAADPWEIDLEPRLWPMEAPRYPHIGLWFDWARGVPPDTVGEAVLTSYPRDVALLSLLAGRLDRATVLYCAGYGNKPDHFEVPAVETLGLEVGCDVSWWTWVTERPHIRRLWLRGAVCSLRFERGESGRFETATLEGSFGGLYPLDLHWMAALASDLKEIVCDRRTHERASESFETWCREKGIALVVRSGPEPT